MKKRKSFLVRNLIIYVLIIIILFFAAFILINSSIKHYLSFIHHEKEIRSNPDLEIETWMTLKTISERFNISEDTLMRTMNFNKDNFDLRFTLNQACVKRNLN